MQLQIIHFKKLCVPVSTGTSKVDKLLKMSQDSISEGAIFQNFLGAYPRPPSAGIYFTCLCASHTMSVNMPASLYNMEALMMTLIA